MALPLEAELANPAIFTPEQEAHILHSPTGDLADDPDLHVTISQRVATTSATDSSSRDAEARGADGTVGSAVGGQHRMTAGFDLRGW